MGEGSAQELPEVHASITYQTTIDDHVEFNRHMLRTDERWKKIAGLLQYEQRKANAGKIGETSSASFLAHNTVTPTVEPVETQPLGMQSRIPQ
ncbi:MAG: hypothetical protein OHK0029_31310 [Armatimonadaceae bacterium]